MISAKDACPEAKGRRMAVTTLRTQTETAGLGRLGLMSTETVEMQTLGASCQRSPLVSMATTVAAAHSLLAASWARRGRRYQAYLSQQRNESSWMCTRVVGIGNVVQD